MNSLRQITLLLWTSTVLLFAGYGFYQTDEPLFEASRIVVYADGEVRSFESAERRPLALFAEAGVQIAPEDILLHNGLPIIKEEPLVFTDTIVLQLQRAQAINLDGQEIKSARATLAAGLWDAGVILRFRDALSPVPQTPLDRAIDVDFVPAIPIIIRIDQQEIGTYSAKETVGLVLQEAGFGLQGLDYSLPDGSMPVPDYREIQVVRVEEEILLEQVSLPFQTLTQPAADLEIDTQQVVQVGQFGLQVSRIRARYEDGIEVRREIEAEWTAVEPKPRIIGYGTKIVVRAVNTSDGPIEYWRAVPAYATSYSPCRLGTDFCGNTTASGLQLEKGLVGVIRSWFNAMVFSQVYVDGYGVGTIADIGAGFAGQNWIDLGYSDDDWVSWSQNVTIYFLTPVPPLDQILWILP